MIKIISIKKKSWEYKSIKTRINSNNNSSKNETSFNFSVIINSIKKESDNNNSIDTNSQKFSFKSFSKNQQILINYIMWEKNLNDIYKIVKTIETKKDILSWFIDFRLNNEQFKRLKIIYMTNNLNIPTQKQFNQSRIICIDKPRWSPITYNQNWNKL